jgi:hypothetical protein
VAGVGDRGVPGDHDPAAGVGAVKRHPLRVFVPRLWYRIRNGRWCPHPNWTPWQMVDLGRRKVRYCIECDYTEVV